MTAAELHAILSTRGTTYAVQTVYKTMRRMTDNGLLDCQGSVESRRARTDEAVENAHAEPVSRSNQLATCQCLSEN